MGAFSYPSEEKLKSKIVIDAIFDHGKSVKAYPMRLHYILKPLSSEDSRLIQVGFSVSKRNFKRAVDRNRVKRLMRESYRLNAVALRDKLQQNGLGLRIMIIWSSNQIPSLTTITDHFIIGRDKLIKKMS